MQCHRWKDHMHKLAWIMSIVLPLILNPIFNAYSLISGMNNVGAMACTLMSWLFKVTKLVCVVGTKVIESQAENQININIGTFLEIRNIYLDVLFEVVECV